jgi:hypothetical protein
VVPSIPEWTPGWQVQLHSAMVGQANCQSEYPRRAFRRVVERKRHSAAPAIRCRVVAITPGGSADCVEKVRPSQFMGELPHRLHRRLNATSEAKRKMLLPIESFARSGVVIRSICGEVKVIPCVEGRCECLHVLSCKGQAQTTPRTNPTSASLSVPSQQSSPP